MQAGLSDGHEKEQGKYIFVAFEEENCSLDVQWMNYESTSNESIRIAIGYSPILGRLDDGFFECRFLPILDVASPLGIF